jgi:VWFA-related protein
LPQRGKRLFLCLRGTADSEQNKRKENQGEEVEKFVEHRQKVTPDGLMQKIYDSVRQKMLSKRQKQLYDTKNFFRYGIMSAGLLLNMKIKSALSVVLAIVLLSVVHFGQTATPTVSPTPNPEDVVKISTNLIQIDVSVTDSKGKVVPGLKAEDFEIYENGQKQKITNFSFVSNEKSTPEAAKPAEKGQPDVPVPPSILKPDQIRRTIALVVDDLSLSFESAYQVRRALKKYVDEQMQDGDLVAIIRTGAGIGALQQFTSDKRILYAAIEKVKWNPQGKGGISAFEPIEPTPLEQARGAGANVSDDDLQAEKNANNEQSDFRNSIFITGTLGALKYVVTGMSELPGRKSVILFSDGFRIMERDRNGFSIAGQVLDFLHQLTDLANRSSVVFYTIDARGLQTTGITAADDVSGAATPQELQAKMSDRSGELFETQSGLAFLAKETGGFAVVNNNDLSGGVQRVLNDQSYYLIGYQPDSDTFDAAKRKFNKLEVKIPGKDVKVRYRSGFFNVAGQNVAKIPVNQTPVQQIQAALTSPFAVNGISLHMNALFGNDVTTGSYVRSLLHVAAKDLVFTDGPDGSKKATFEILAASFGDNGQIVDQLGRSYTISVHGDGYKKILADGFVYHFAFPVKKPGAYQYRVAIRDSQGGTVGSASQFIEVPNLKKNRISLSSVVLEDLSQDQWKQLMAATGPASSGDPMTDTALRRAHLGYVLRYGIEIYNAALDASKRPNLTAKVRVFREGKLMLDGKPLPIDPTGQNDMSHIGFSGAISLGKEMPAGDYILQIIVTDNLAKEKQKVATQFVQFEVVP